LPKPEDQQPETVGPNHLHHCDHKDNKEFDEQFESVKNLPFSRPRRKKFAGVCRLGFFQFLCASVLVCASDDAAARNLPHNIADFLMGLRQIDRKTLTIIHVCVNGPDPPQTEQHNSHCDGL
jgi:hypothetical protein